jgi:hypothetical protein
MSQIFVYGNSVYQDVADGYGVSNSTTTETMFYFTGYVFYGYSYLDEYGNNVVVDYVYDGASGYSIYYS